MAQLLPPTPIAPARGDRVLSKWFVVRRPGYNPLAVISLRSVG